VAPGRVVCRRGVYARHSSHAYRRHPHLGAPVHLVGPYGERGWPYGGAFPDDSGPGHCRAASRRRGARRQVR
jgi:hypothetical protein